MHFYIGRGRDVCGAEWAGCGGRRWIGMLPGEPGYGRFRAEFGREIVAAARMLMGEEIGDGVFYCRCADA